jgi:hypothetical protein
MRFALTILTTVALLGCSDKIAPTAPTPGAATVPAASVRTMVAEDSGICITGATVEVIAGQGLGRTYTQTEPCDVWDVGGVDIKDLEYGVEMRLRASASGYVVQEKIVVPSLLPQAVIFTLTKSP